MDLVCTILAGKVLLFHMVAVIDGLDEKSIFFCEAKSKLERKNVEQVSELKCTHQKLFQ